MIFIQFLQYQVIFDDDVVNNSKDHEGKVEDELFTVPAADVEFVEHKRGQKHVDIRLKGWSCRVFRVYQHDILQFDLAEDEFADQVFFTGKGETEEDV